MPANNNLSIQISNNQTIFIENNREFNWEFRILENIRGVVFELDPDGNISYLNKAWSDLTGHSRNMTLAKPLGAYIHPDDATPYQAMINRMRAADDDHVTHEIRLRHKDGHSLWVALSLDIKQTKKGEALFGYIASIDKRQLGSKSLSYSTAHDAVTGAYSRHYFEFHLQSRINKLAVQPSCHSLIYLELLNFKLINQALSHSDGDIVLKEIASLLSSCIGSNDLLCRMDGYAFALF